MKAGYKHTYEPARRCIYCGIEESSGEKLADEHIIPLSFEGNFVIPSASCRGCERITSAIEDHCVKALISTARPHLGIRGRQKKKKKTLSRGPIYIDQGYRTETRSVPLRDHPGILMMPVMDYPGVLLGADLPQNKDEPVAVRIAIRSMTDDIPARISRIGITNLNFTKGFNALTGYRFFAKIAHAFACAELGTDGFSPCLLNLIRGKSPMFASHFVGSAIVDEPGSPHLHEIGFAPTMAPITPEMIVVRMRLFGNLNMPTHYAVVGSRSVPA